MNCVRAPDHLMVQSLKCLPWGHGVLKSCTGTSAFVVTSVEK